MNKPIRILQIIDNMSNGGIESVVMNYYRNIDRTKVQFDFAVSDVSQIPQKDEIISLGGKIFITPRVTKFLKYKKELAKIIKENNYQIVHCHMGALAVFPLGVAKKCGVPYRICHAHSTASPNELVRTMIKNMLKPFSKKNANIFFSCGELAGRWLYGNKFFNQGKVKVINNAIDLEKFKYNEVTRNKTRNELDVENNFVVGHIGRFNKQKNHDYLIDIFKEVSKIKDNAVLLLAGDGPLEDVVKQKVDKLNIADKVKFLGVRKDAYNLYQAMDAFVLPSLYEGLPVVGVEAQAAGVSVFVSDKISKEVKISDNLAFIRLKDSAKVWADKIVNATEHQNNEEKLQKMNFDIKIESSKLTNFYLNLLKD